MPINTKSKASTIVQGLLFSKCAQLKVSAITLMAPPWWSLDAYGDAQPNCADLAARLALDPAISAFEIDKTKHPAAPPSKRGTP